MPNRITHSDELPYDNSSSGLDATNVQDAIDEIATQAGSNDDLVVDESLVFVLDESLTSVEQEH